jgi:hypothetical protein
VGTPFEGLDVVTTVVVGDAGDVVKLVDEPGVEIIAFVETEVGEPNRGGVMIKVAVATELQDTVALEL